MRSWNGGRVVAVAALALAHVVAPAAVFVVAVVVAIVAVPFLIPILLLKTYPALVSYTTNTPIAHTRRFLSPLILFSLAAPDINDAIKTC